jgi:hypothetical protein
MSNMKYRLQLIDGSEINCDSYEERENGLYYTKETLQCFIAFAKIDDVFMNRIRRK